MDITIRQAKIEDIDVLLGINLSSFESNAAYDKYIDMNWVNTDHAKKLFTTAITDEDHYTIMAEAEGKAIGFLLLAPKELTYRTGKTIELEILAVLPQYRSKGVGSQLVAKAKERAKATGNTTIMVSSYSKNDRAIEFYKREGFEIIDVSLEYELA